MDNLVEKAKNGDKTAEKELFEHLFVRFRAFATHRLGDDEAEDVAQEACLAVLKKYKTEVFITGFGAWAYGVLKMEIKSHARIRSQRATRLESKYQIDMIPGTSRSEIDYDLRERLAICLKKIVRRNRSYARVLNFIHQGYKSDEICERLRMKPNNFYVTLSRGRQLLRICLQKGTV